MTYLLHDSDFIAIFCGTQGVRFIPMYLCISQGRLRKRNAFQSSLIHLTLPVIIIFTCIIIISCFDLDFFRKLRKAKQPRELDTNFDHLFIGLIVCLLLCHIQVNSTKETLIWYTKPHFCAAKKIHSSMKLGYLYWRLEIKFDHFSCVGVAPPQLFTPQCARREQSRGSYSNAGKMDQTWSRKTSPSLSPQTVLGRR